MSNIQFGDIIRCTLEGEGRVDSENMVCIGHMQYAIDGDVVLLASEKVLGFPVSVHWCDKQLGEAPEDAAAWRQRYKDTFPLCSRLVAQLPWRTP